MQPLPNLHIYLISKDPRNADSLPIPGCEADTSVGAGYVARCDLADYFLPISPFDEMLPIYESISPQGQQDIDRLRGKSLVFINVSVHSFEIVN